MIHRPLPQRGAPPAALVRAVVGPTVRCVSIGGMMTRCSVLLVEDNPDEVQLVCEALAGIDADIAVQVAPDVERAWLMLSATVDAALPALVITDHHLPDARGQDLIARLRACPTRACLPVVMVSGDAVRPPDLDAVAWFTKPDTWSGWCALARELVTRISR
jgi:DNA-binding response OmpR family regulator